ncbi:hypothetical protein IE81DRAFT_350556 [Ceraceosorus guamensis]|uniref:Uncharacterized protein n=1 Tax=Ceraceosorus guamensis TaxID=1522189 RepID=A0A316VN53_9BASI|nr:hypothetical protein IE81DRAFT_350556 [Ceraceosorus guamensis]PWN39002.1 hypothetical protein IE81DRAFT_350556 [Ceraceosorus guamensis]
MDSSAGTGTPRAPEPAVLNATGMRRYGHYGQESNLTRRRDPAPVATPAVTEVDDDPRINQVRLHAESNVRQRRIPAPFTAPVAGIDIDPREEQVRERMRRQWSDILRGTRWRQMREEALRVCLPACITRSVSQEVQLSVEVYIRGPDFEKTSWALFHQFVNPLLFPDLTRHFRNLDTYGQVIEGRSFVGRRYAEHLPPDGDPKAEAFLLRTCQAYVLALLGSSNFAGQAALFYKLGLACTQTIVIAFVLITYILANFFYSGRHIFSVTQSICATTFVAWFLFYQCWVPLPSDDVWDNAADLRSQIILALLENEDQFEQDQSLRPTRLAFDELVPVPDTLDDTRAFHPRKAWMHMLVCLGAGIADALRRLPSNGLISFTNAIGVNVQPVIAPTLSEPQGAVVSEAAVPE